ncbi:hypothetical protein [Streptomyces chiangmaiensis]|uniref:Uncharacterized protein n=1 Tax=Streptomyces chiangmaiensis TaxID=766497 RepID=A0ABU7FWK6_9ACTN|nr:hypothetical protein [Streptomyces chiangmaiensis]MED7828173.1 hypothetical protein [Streptomyces chiangmaiensis]
MTLPGREHRLNRAFHAGLRARQETDQPVVDGADQLGAADRVGHQDDRRCGTRGLLGEALHRGQWFVRRRRGDNVRRSFKPSSEALAEVTSLLAPGGVRR